MSFLSFNVILMRYMPEEKVAFELMSAHSIDVMPFRVRKLLARPKSTVRVTVSSSRSTIGGNLKVHDDGTFVF